MQLFRREFSGKTTRLLTYCDKKPEMPPQCPGPSSGTNSCRSGLPSRYRRLKRLTQKMNIASISGPKMTPMNPKSDSPMKTPKMVGNGRWLHNLIEQGIIKCMAQRIMSQPSIPDNTFLFRTITQEDVVKAGNRLRGKQVVKLEPQPIRRIGFRA